MARGRGGRTWIKLYCYQRLHGSVCYQLDEAEQSVWDKILCLAGLCSGEGVIADNDGRAYPHTFIAHDLHTDLDLLERTLAKCKDEGRITEDEGGLHITNWTAYQSEYDRQKPYRDKRHKGAEENEGALSITIKGKAYAIDDEMMAEIRGLHPDLDIESELPRFVAYWDGSRRALKNLKLAILNWLKKAEEIKKDNPQRKEFSPANNGAVPTSEELDAMEAQR